MNKKTDYSTKINNPNLDDNIASIAFSINSSDVFDSLITTTIDIRLNNQAEYNKIFEQRIKKNYIKSNGKISIDEEIFVPICNSLSDNEIKSILSFISYNKRAMTMFTQYLFEINKQNLLNDKKNVEIKQEQLFNFEEYSAKLEDDNMEKFSGFYSIQFKKDNKYEKIIKIKNNNEWSILYYCIYYKDNDEIIIDSEMCKSLSDIEIETISNYIKKSARCVEDLDLYLNRTNNFKSKKY